MITLNIPQGTTEWLTARLWRLTASQMKTNITSTGKLSKSEAAMKAIDKLIAGIELANVMFDQKSQIDEMDEWELKNLMSHYTGEKFSGSIHTLRGNDLEPDALAKLSHKIGKQIDDVGMCIMGDDENGVVSCSPDGRIMVGGKMVEGAEVKSPCLCTYNTQLISGDLPSEYKLQVHAGMAVCDVDTWNFGSYFKGKPLLYQAVKRDGFTDTLQSSLIDFKDLYAERFRDYEDKLEALMNEEASQDREEGII